jgi:hypothetical protein
VHFALCFALGFAPLHFVRVNSGKLDENSSWQTKAVWYLDAAMKANTDTTTTPCIVIMEDWHAEKSGFFRAYSADSPDSETVCPMVGYCSAYGPFTTIRGAAMDARRRDSKTPIYRGFRNGSQSRLLSI